RHFLRENPDQDGGERQLPRNRHVHAGDREHAAHRQREQHQAERAELEKRQGGSQLGIPRHHLSLRRAAGAGGEEAGGMMRDARWPAVAIFTALLGSCASQPPAPPAAPKPPAAKAVASTRDAAVAETVPYVYSYNPLAKRDPFRSLVEEVRSPTAESSACAEP